MDNLLSHLKYNSLWYSQRVVKNVRVAAAAGGQIHILNHASRNFKEQSRSCFPHYMPLHAAVKYQQLDVIRWFKEKGELLTRWMPRACVFAAILGHVHVLECLIDNGGRYWDQGTCFKAAECGHLHLLQWAVANGCPWNPQGCRYVARQHFHNHVADWIDDNSNGN